MGSRPTPAPIAVIETRHEFAAGDGRCRARGRGFRACGRSLNRRARLIAADQVLEDVAVAFGDSAIEGQGVGGDGVRANGRGLRRGASLVEAAHRRRPKPALRCPRQTGFRVARRGHCLHASRHRQLTRDRMSPKASATPQRPDRRRDRARRDRDLRRLASARPRASNAITCANSGADAFVNEPWAQAIATGAPARSPLGQSTRRASTPICIAASPWQWRSTVAASCRTIRSGVATRRSVSPLCPGCPPLPCPTGREGCRERAALPQPVARRTAWSSSNCPDPIAGEARRSPHAASRSTARSASFSAPRNCADFEPKPLDQLANLRQGVSSRP